MFPINFQMSINIKILLTNNRCLLNAQNKYIATKISDLWVVSHLRRLLRIILSATLL